MKIKALIVDDEPLARDRLKGMLAREADVYLVEEAADGDEAVHKVLALKPDIMFLDVQMPKKDGFGVLKALEGGRLPVVIFTTAFDQHALQAFESHAIDYLLKPFKASRFHEAMARARENLAGRGAQEAVNRLLKLMAEREAGENHLVRIPVKLDDRTIFVEVTRIGWIEASGNYMTLHCGKENYLVRETMASLEQQLPPEKFIRINRSALVNLEHVKELQPLRDEDHALVLKSGEVLEMSRGVREVEHWLKYS